MTICKRCGQEWELVHSCPEHPAHKRAALAKTGAERQQALLERRKAAGLKQVRNLWCHPDDEPAIREHAAKLARKRAKIAPASPRGT